METPSLHAANPIHSKPHLSRHEAEEGRGLGLRSLGFGRFFSPVLAPSMLSSAEVWTNVSCSLAAVF